MENINPNIYKKTDDRSVTKDELDEDVVDPIDEREIFGKDKEPLIFKKADNSKSIILYSRFNPKHQ